MKLPKAFNLPCAWTGAELAQHTERWVREFTASEISEINNAAERFESAGHPIEQISPENFLLPTVGPVLIALRKQLQTGIGFTLLKGLPVDQYAIETACTVFCGIGSYLGSARSQNAHGHLLGHVRDVGGDLTNTNVRIYQTANRQTFHTDSCDAVGLMCLKEAMEGGDSLLAATHTLYNEVMKRRPELAPYLFKPIATDRRGEVPEGVEPFFMIPVLSWHKGKMTGLYHRLYINSASRFSEAPQPDPQHIEALDLFDEIANDPTIHLSMRLQPGDIQFVYNHTNLHDRTAFRDWPEQDKRRHLLRLWLALPEDRELPAVFQERYGTIEIGNRGGIIVKGTELNVPLAPAGIKK